MSEKRLISVGWLIVAMAAAIAAQGPAPDARDQLVAAKTALYDSNFRNDAAGLRTAVDQAVAATKDEPVRSMALYYAAWGEWTIAHSRLQTGDLQGAVAALTRSEEYARVGLARRPDDAEFVVMLADALIWRLVAEPQRSAESAAEIRALRSKALDLAPENPRAIIMDAGLLFNNPPERGGSREKGLARWQQAIALFEHEATQPAGDALRPDWGLALSYAWVCDLYLGMRPHQIEEARAAARKALQLRPDFWYVNEVVMPRLK